MNLDEGVITVSFAAKERFDLSALGFLQKAFESLYAFFLSCGVVFSLTQFNKSKRIVEFAIKLG